MNVLFLPKNLRNISIANKDEINEDNIPIKIGMISSKDKSRQRVINSIAPDKKIAGIPTRNESLAAVCLLIPENKADVKVIPDLETPGNIAKDWAVPSNKISPILISLNSLFF